MYSHAGTHLWPNPRMMSSVHRDFTSVAAKRATDTEDDARLREAQSVEPVNEGSTPVCPGLRVPPPHATSDG